MFRSAMQGFILVASVFMAGAAFAADDPSMHQIYEAAQAGRLSDAQGMINQVLKDHPNSAKAHFVDAEILAKSGHIAEARNELNNAEKLEPGLPFAKPQAVQELKAKVGETSSAMTPISASQGTQSGFPWGLLLLGLGVIAVIAFFMRPRAASNVTPAPYYPGNYQPGMQPGMSPAGGGFGAAPAAPGIGSGIMSGLATGAAVGVGMVAGEALVHHFMDGNHPDANQPQPIANAGNDMGGNDFGIADNSSWDDNSSVADSSSGDDWT